VKLFVPQRGSLLATLPLICAVRPLVRARSRGRGMGVYQPLVNQEDLFQAIRFFQPMHIDFPCFVDIIVNWAPPQKRKSIHCTSTKNGDIDNIAKAVNDALVKQKILTDDIHIVGQAITKAYGDHDQSSVVIWAATDVIAESASWEAVSSLDTTSALLSMPPFPISPPAANG
jgi:Holliday junction resolvase RusA-like endonuclease